MHNNIHFDGMIFYEKCKNFAIIDLEDIHFS